LFNRIITIMVRREFARVMRFEEGKKPEIPPGDAMPRLLYLHIPFCERLCPYCSFHRVVFQEALGHDYFAALRKEIRYYKEKGYDFRGVYVGGGTPTVMIEELEETLNYAGECFPLREISVETNPNHLTDRHVAALKRAGVNRLSVGIQSFDKGLLQAMDRYDKYGSGEAIAERLKATLGHFETLNADMIFNFPAQDLRSLNRDLDILMDMGIDQITYYPLMVSDSTRQMVNRTLGKVDYGKEEKLYRQIVKRLTPTYAFSSAWCFSRKKDGAVLDEYIVDYDEYAGLGSGSIGYLKGTCYANTFDIPGYISLLNQGKSPLWASRDFTLKDKIRYDFLMKLFATKLDMTALRKKYGGVLNRHLWPNILAFSILGGLQYDPPYLRLTKSGHYLWVIMMREFFIAVNNFRDYCRNGISDIKK
jgi:coproporphyrinogen III oxidase-like Fe-S oxidoreductase